MTSKRLELRLIERENEYSSYKQYPILVGTFNVNNRSAPSDSLLEEWFDQVCFAEQTKDKIIPDIIAVGFQEIDTSGGAYIYDDKRKEDEWGKIVLQTIEKCFPSAQFIGLQRVRLIGILLFVYVRSIHQSKCSLVYRSTVPTGFMGITGNKGGVGIRLRFYESDLCFVNAHFASGDGQTQRRNEDYQAIESRMAFTDANVNFIKDIFWQGLASNSAEGSTATNQWWKISDHDIIFWCGDMNYRISQANDLVRKLIQESSSQVLQDKDQLRCEMSNGKTFIDYDEAPIDFDPTYKFDINSDQYDTSEKSRTPSWTDRILFRSKRSHVRLEDKSELRSIGTIRYAASKNIKFSDHRPVSGLYLVAIKDHVDKGRANQIREELLRESDRLENDSIPTIEIQPRPPQIIFDKVRYLDRPTYSLTIKNIGPCPCTCSIIESTISESFSSLVFMPSSSFMIDIAEVQHVQISINHRDHQKPINEVIILRVEGGSDTFISVDVTFDRGPFGLPLDQHPPTYYDQEEKKYVLSPVKKPVKETLVEMKMDPPILYLALIDCLKERANIDLINVFSSETQDSLDLIPLRDQIYENSYDFQNYSSAELFMILFHLLRSLPEPLISRQIQEKIFEHRQDLDDINKKTVPILIEHLKGKERNLFFHFLLLIQSCWIRIDKNSNSIKQIIDILASSILHEYFGFDQRYAFLQACLTDDKTSK